MKLKIVKSHLPAKKYDAIFTFNDGKTKTVPFGAAGYSDYTIHHDKERRQRYIARHRNSEQFNDPMTAGSLSKWILWGASTSIRENIRDFKKRFNLK
jgi:hypothetical protein